MNNGYNYYEFNTGYDYWLMTISVFGPSICLSVHHATFNTGYDYYAYF